MRSRPGLLRLFKWAFFLACAAGSAVMSLGSLGYFDDEALPAFVVEKLPELRFEALWLAALKTHVVAAAFSLPACLLLVTGLSLRAPALHRWLGRVTGVVVLFALVPSGVILAFDAKGGRWVGAGFLASAAVVAWGMVQGVVSARAKDFVTHRRAVWHVLAQMSVAVSSRALLLGLDAVGVDPDAAYVVALWLPVTASALAVELAFPRRTTAERNRRESPAPAVGRLVPVVVARPSR